MTDNKERKSADVFEDLHKDISKIGTSREGERTDDDPLNTVAAARDFDKFVKRREIPIDRLAEEADGKETNIAEVTRKRLRFEAALAAIRDNKNNSQYISDALVSADPRLVPILAAAKNPAFSYTNDGITIEFIDKENNKKRVVTVKRDGSIEG